MDDWERQQGRRIRAGRQTRRGACDSEISIVRAPLCVLCEVYFGGAGGGSREGRGREEGGDPIPGPQTSGTLSSPMRGGTCGVMPLFRPVEGMEVWRPA